MEIANRSRFENHFPSVIALDPSSDRRIVGRFFAVDNAPLVGTKKTVTLREGVPGMGYASRERDAAMSRPQRPIASGFGATRT
jgi:hypothetical protein